ncbi:MAG TPA: hypothetical protein VE084_08345, partial [Burkholderiaceae bacterium]|nr:hypothetical protein [Burkholderiaceae bacterium]
MTRACGHCLHLLHGPVAFCPYCGTPRDSAPTPAERAPVSSAAVPMPAPVLALEAEDDAAPPVESTPPPLPAPASRPGDPQAPARRLVIALTALVAALAAVIVYLALFDVPPEPVSAQGASG